MHYIGNEAVSGLAGYQSAIPPVPFPLVKSQLLLMLNIYKKDEYIQRNNRTDNSKPAKHCLYQHRNRRKQ